MPEPDRTGPGRTGPAAAESADTEPDSTEADGTEEGSTGRRELGIPELSLVVLIGVSGSGKTTFARQHFGPFEVLSSDFCRGLVADDENDQAATADAFDVLAYIAGKRLAGGRLTVVDATNVQPFARKQLVELARAHDVLPVAIVLDLPKSLCTQRNSGRADRTFGAPVVHRQHDQLRRSLRGLGREGFRKIHVLRSPAQVEAAVVVRERLLTDYRDRTGPFDVIGDVHGCRAELEALLAKLGYLVTRDASARAVDAVPPDGRTAVFLGDLVDRGPDSPGVLRLVMGPPTWPGSGTATWAASAHWHCGSTRWDSRPWNGVPGATRCGGYTRPCSGYSRWNPSRSTHACNPPAGMWPDSGKEAREAGASPGQRPRPSGHVPARRGRGRQPARPGALPRQRRRCPACGIPAQRPPDGPHHRRHRHYHQLTGRYHRLTGRYH